MELVQATAALCQQTSAVILSIYQNRAAFGVQKKGDNSPVTAADLAAHEILSSGLPKILDIPIISEEGSAHCTQSHDYWLIDPIDGTQEFISQTGNFSILIARITNNRPTFGMIFAPVSGQYWFAEKGKGAFKFDGQKISQIFCAANSPQLRAITARPPISKRMKNYCEAVLGADYEHKFMASALKLAVLAEGNADLYPKISLATSEWDIAAGDLLVHEAGGKLLTADGQPMRYGVRDCLLNPPFIAFSPALAEAQIQTALQLLDATN